MGSISSISPIRLLWMQYQISPQASDSNSQRSHNAKKQYKISGTPSQPPQKSSHTDLYPTKSSQAQANFLPQSQPIPIQPLEEHLDFCPQAGAGSGVRLLCYFCRILYRDRFLELIIRSFGIRVDYVARLAGLGLARLIPSLLFFSNSLLKMVWAIVFIIVALQYKYQQCSSLKIGGQDIIICLNMQAEDKAKVKSQEKSTTELQCPICAKTYPKEADLQSHIKLKHDKPEKQKQRQKEKQKEPSKSRPAKAQPRNRVLEMQQNDHEDTIYSYLGELGEKNQENGAREELLLVDENQRQAIQTNYSFNKVVRTPYEKELVVTNVVPKDWVEKSPHKEFISTLVVEMTLLYHALEAEKDKWQFRDPMTPEEEAEDEFSLMEIRKLILNYPRRKLTLKYPHFSIYLLWIGRICKPLAWEEFFIIISYYLAEYYSRGLTGKPSERWEKFNTDFQNQPIKPYVLEKIVICDERTVKKFADFFNKWTTLFDLVNDFC